MLNSLWWMIFYVVLLFTSLLLGIRYGTVHKKKRSWESSGIENAIIGIFGLIISFTFLQAGNAHRERSANLHREVNNIDMLYRYSRELPDSMYRYTQVMLTGFLQNQLHYEKTGDVTTFATSRKMSDTYWKHLRHFKKQAAPQQAEIVDKISGYFEQIMAAATSYAYANYERTPVFIMFLLITVSLLIGFLVGFMNGIKSRVHFLVPIIYFVTISLTMLVISDLNNPRIGLIRPGYHHLQAAYDFIKQ
ncbi:hypothetical protein U0035_11520 [Niabella yanshanensis]|uniref:DUF4239 domain-containing protein n=1 Tax=Niabella yanshanensis TaxID=577386 RepID=A0ABZ0VZB5_9BACT|nr:hypothetical protein [Niabella yanshanensis]WQD36292.1 hypothetical protein U0035_11520 [Niabella yanshanensis]